MRPRRPVCPGPAVARVDRAASPPRPQDSPPAVSGPAWTLPGPRPAALCPLRARGPAQLRRHPGQRLADQHRAVLGRLCASGPQCPAGCRLCLPPQWALGEASLRPGRIYAVGSSVHHGLRAPGLPFRPQLSFREELLCTCWCLQCRKLPDWLGLHTGHCGGHAVRLPALLCQVCTQRAHLAKPDASYFIAVVINKWTSYLKQRGRR